MKKPYLSLISKILVFTLSLNLIMCGTSVGFGAATEKTALTAASPTQAVPQLKPGNKLPAGAQSLTGGQSTELTQDPQLDSSASKWAVPELKQAYKYGLTYPGVMSNFKRSINREEFCTIVVKLYEKLTNKTVTAGESKFNDTGNPEIIKANQLGIVEGTGGGRFSPKLNITRQEISVMIYRTLNVSIDGLDKSPPDNFPFDDKGKIASWAMEAMQFAYKNSILQGSGNIIMPLDNTTREQAIAIVKRTYEAFKPGEDGTKGSGLIDKLEPKAPGSTGKLEPKDPGSTGKLEPKQPDLTDEIQSGDKAGGLISGLIKENPGIRIPDLIAKGSAISPGTGKIVKLPDNAVVVGKALGGIEKIEKTVHYDKDNTLIYPKYKTCLDLKVATAPDKNSPYSAGVGAGFIDRDGIKTRWFSFELKNAPGVKKVVWQVSRSPFTGFAGNWKKPVGLVKSGETPLSAKGFSIDFGTFAPSWSAAADKYRIGSNGALLWGGDGKFREIPSAQIAYYVRAVPVDASGKPVGDPGTGITVFYGKPLTAPSVRSLTVSPSFELWSAAYEGDLGGSPEFLNITAHKPERTLEAGTKDYCVQFKGFNAASTKAIVQVSMKPFTGSLAAWESPEGLVYSRTYNFPITLQGKDYPNAVPIDLTAFAPTYAAMKAGDKILYYIRGVTLKPLSNGGSVGVSFSDTVTLTYKKMEPVKLYKSDTAYAKSYIPSIRIKSYNPIKHVCMDWNKYYEVYRAPKWNEIRCTYLSLDNSNVLKPYSSYVLDYKNLGWPRVPTYEEYEKLIIPKVLPIGTTVIINQDENKKSWWGELWDSILDFFSDILKVIEDLVNWASNAYASLKSSLVNFVASALPIEVPGLRAALEMLVNAGLMFVGLPPTIPNFDKLCEQGLGYMAEVALTSAGVAPNEMTTDLITKTAKAIGDKVSETYETPSPNPIDAPFLRLHPDHQEKPASLELELSNPYDKASLPGSFNIDVEWPCPPGGPFVSEDMGIPGNNLIGYINHVTFGLQRGVERGSLQGYYVDYPVFKPLRGYKIPSLKPGEKLIVTIYLEPCFGAPYPFAPQGDAVSEYDFNFLYGLAGDLNFHVYTDTYDLPDPKEAALKQGFKPDPDTFYIYEYDKLHSSAGFSGSGNSPYNP